MAKRNSNFFNKSSLSLLLICIVLGTITTSYSQEAAQKNKLEFSAGFDMLIYQSVYGMNDSYGIELFVGKYINDPVKWQSGIRLGINPVLPEVFLRLLVNEEFGIWKPAIGLESGYSNRAYFESSSNLLKETREAMVKDIGIFYISSHAEPFVFEISKKFEISVLEIDFGTHYKNFGRTLRLQTTILRLTTTF